MSHMFYGEHRIRMSSTCHVCERNFVDDDVVVEHSGIIEELDPNETKATPVYGSITLHQECATILAMRLLYDVMDIHHTPESIRVVDSLKQIRDAYNMK